MPGTQTRQYIEDFAHNSKKEWPHPHRGAPNYAWGNNYNFWPICMEKMGKKKKLQTKDMDDLQAKPFQQLSSHQGYVLCTVI